MSLQLDAIAFRSRLLLNAIVNGVEQQNGFQDVVMGDCNGISSYIKLTSAQQAALLAFVQASIAPGGNGASKGMVLTYIDVNTGNCYALDGDTGVRQVFAKANG